MGFGILIFGYFVAFIMSMSLYHYLFALVGYFLIFEALIRLIQYERKFVVGAYLLIPMTACSLYSAAKDIASFVSYDDIGVFTDTVSNCVGYAEAVLIVAFVILMSLAVNSLSVSVGAEKPAGRAKSTIIFIAFYLVTYIPLSVFHSSLGMYASYFDLGIIVLQLCWKISALLTAYSCFREICDENDVDMPRKKSRFAFVNRMREESDKRQAEINARFQQKANEKMNKKGKK